MRKNLLALALTTVAVLVAVVTTVASNNLTYAQPLERDPIPAVPVVDNVTGEAEPIQMTISADEFLPANGTMTLSMVGMNDIDFKRTPPAGITVVVTNDSATVTNHPVPLPSAVPAAAGALPSLPPPSSSSADESSSDDPSADEEG